MRIESLCLTPAMTPTELRVVDFGTEHEVYVFEFHGKQYIIKQFLGRDGGVLLEKYPPKVLIHYLRKIYCIARNYLPLVDTLYFLAPDEVGDDGVFLFQPFVVGDRVEDPVRIAGYRKKWFAVGRDPEVLALPSYFKNYMYLSDMSPAHVLQCGKKVSIIDW